MAKDFYLFHNLATLSFLVLFHLVIICGIRCKKKINKNLILPTIASFSGWGIPLRHSALSFAFVSTVYDVCDYPGSMLLEGIEAFLILVNKTLI